MTNATFVVYVTKGRRKQFLTAEEAKSFCEKIFAATGIVLSITEQCARRKSIAPK